MRVLQPQELAQVHLELTSMRGAEIVLIRPLAFLSIGTLLRPQLLLLFRPGIGRTIQVWVKIHDFLQRQALLSPKETHMAMAGRLLLQALALVWVH